ncbi:MAG: hypothetical protein KGJ90_03835 [Patescibacteria group bacterium]|nr:hypothetical protein [Patescibacteria group bacterium]
MPNRAEHQFDRQTSRYRPRVTFKKNLQLVFRRKLGKENRAMIWIHQDRHAEIDRLAEATGLTMTQVADVLIRFALNQMVVIRDDGTDEELKKYLDDQLGISEVPIEAIQSLETPQPLTGET